MFRGMRDFPPEQAILRPPAHTLPQEVECMNKCKVPVIHCEYAETERCLAQLIEESFRLFLARSLEEQSSQAADRRRE